MTATLPKIPRQIAGQSAANAGGRISGRHRVVLRCRANVVWGLGCFLLIQLITALLADQRYPEIRDPGYSHRLRTLHRRLAAEPERPLLLILGSSRAENGFRPDAMALAAIPTGAKPLVFNFALAGSKPLDQLVCLQRLLAENVRPRWLLIEVLPVTLNNPAEVPQHILSRYSFRDVSFARPYVEHGDQLRLAWCELASVPWSTHRLHLLDQLAHSWLPVPLRSNIEVAWKFVDDDGWQANLKYHMNDTDRAQRLRGALKQYRGQLEDCITDPRVDRCLHVMVRLCRANNVEPLFYLMPEGSEFQKLYSPRALKTIEGYLKRLHQETDVPIVDARAWMPQGEHYLDGHHLLPPGATAFSERFGREVLAPFVRQSRPPIGVPLQARMGKAS
jgi:hypothetical protein